jgi:PHD/YefM family antitoxin component YafN of YafNO toxin-antitoxin module
MKIVNCSRILKYHTRTENKCTLIFFKNNENNRIEYLSKGDHHFAVEETEHVFMLEHNQEGDKFYCITLDKLNMTQETVEDIPDPLESTGMFLKNLLGSTK